MRLTLFLLMFGGGCTGSTAGGMKLARLVIFFKSAAVELRRNINPKAVLVVRLGARSLDRNTVSNVTSFMLLWLLVFGIGTVVLTAMGLDMLSAATATVANLGNVGPGLGSVGPTQNFAHIPAAGKWLLAFAQLLGRLEVYSVLVLFLRRTWIR